MWHGMAMCILQLLPHTTFHGQHRTGQELHPASQPACCVHMSWSVMLFTSGAQLAVQTSAVQGGCNAGEAVPGYPLCTSCYKTDAVQKPIEHYLGEVEARSALATALHAVGAGNGQHAVKAGALANALAVAHGTCRGTNDHGRLPVMHTAPVLQLPGWYFPSMHLVVDCDQT